MPPLPPPPPPARCACLPPTHPPSSPNPRHGDRPAPPPPLARGCGWVCTACMAGRYAELSGQPLSAPQAACEPQDRPSNQIKSNLTSPPLPSPPLPSPRLPSPPLPSPPLPSPPLPSPPLPSPPLTRALVWGTHGTEVSVVRYTRESWQGTAFGRGQIDLTSRGQCCPCRPKTPGRLHSTSRNLCCQLSSPGLVALARTVQVLRLVELPKAKVIPGRMWHVHGPRLVPPLDVCPQPSPLLRHMVACGMQRPDRTL